MKLLVSLFAATAALASAGAALAEDSVTVNGTAERICTLPSSWAFVSAGGGANGANFTGTTWTIPEAAFSDAASIAVPGAEYAIRVRGTGICNTAHTIRLTSGKGGLVSDSSASAPTGFANRRAMKYDAYWSDNGSNAYGPTISYTPTTAGQQSTVANYVVSNTRPPPGNRTFDVRLGLQRGAIAQPLVAGAYSDTLTVTIALAP